MDWVRGHEIGHGSFATINLATPSSGDRFPPLMAVKSSELVCSSSLKNEKQILDLLGDDCPQIIRCFGESCSVENGEELYNLFLEYATGGSLADRIQSCGGRLPEFEVRRYTRTILEGLRYIHGKGFVHCDVKPRNILVFGDGDAKIADFGLSKKAGKNRVETGEETGRFQLRGSPLYMSPESLNDNEYESPCDIWAVGCAVVEMFTGKPAWNCRPESNVFALLIKIGIGEELPEIPKDLSEEGKDFLRKCLVKDPVKRWTADMLLKHPFVADSGRCVPLGEMDEVSTSPRCPFDFEDWASIHSQERDPRNEEESNCWLNSSCSWSSSSPRERLLQLVEKGAVDWSVTDNWVRVR
ncbi:hypothetical protein IC582_018163 [Cucumis melo]|nr:mitogen-activated protein kinase kinase kinase 20-like [Cucumis melo]TYK12881.1 mitogen-activated protein kinase kinase kinase 3-like [Cucumis melo var. makuwa]